MCLIIYRRPGVALDTSSSMFTSAFRRNHDGWGVMYAEEGKVKTHKGFDKKGIEEVISSLVAQEKEFFVHLRMATHGKVIEENTHPFDVGAGIYMMHNGVLSLSITDPVKSDTAIFAESVQKLINYNPNILSTKEFEQFCLTYARSDRLVFLQPDGTFYFHGGGKWTEYEDLLLSNTYAWDKYDYMNPFYYKDAYDDYLGMPASDYYFESRYGTAASLKAASTLTDEYDFGYEYSPDDVPFDLKHALQEKNIPNKVMFDLDELMNMSREDMNSICWSHPSAFADSVYEAFRELVNEY